MFICKTVSDLKQKLALPQADTESIGFVPTMGALHKGHLSLLAQAKKENNFTVVSIFVNPTQFNDQNDFNKYPRDVDSDIGLLETSGCDLVFIPGYEEVYPAGPSQKQYDLGGLDKVMEGPSRPGHFNGVAMVVHRFFDLIKPTNAYFGEKDFQQLAIIKYMVKSLNLPLSIHGCPIMREAHGLAMSSRNERLSDQQRQEAGAIFSTLLQAKKHWTEFASPAELKTSVINKINQNPYLQVEYFELVEAETLASITNLAEAENPVGCIAVNAGDVRLIDNIQFYS